MSLNCFRTGCGITHPIIRFKEESNPDAVHLNFGGGLKQLSF